MQIIQNKYVSAVGLSSAAFVFCIDTIITKVYNIFRNTKYYEGETVVNFGFWVCMVLVPFFAVLALIFYMGKEKATMLLAGFNTLPKKERVLYDRARMARDTAKDFAVWTLVMLVGALVSQWISPYAAIVAYVIWFVLLFKDMHTDARKAFEKYLLK